MQAAPQVEQDSPISDTEDRRRLPRFSDRRAEELAGIAHDKERLLRNAKEHLERGEVQEALEAVEIALAYYPRLWVLREEFFSQLRLELEALRDGCTAE